MPDDDVDDEVLRGLPWPSAFFLCFLSFLFFFAGT